jgi:transcriptional regulator with XRE-family HTH domain
MLSQQKTPVAVLRQLLDLSVEEFAQLVGKSVSTVTKLENGQLKLSEETAHTIYKETGVDMGWLLAGNPNEKPYMLHYSGNPMPFEKEAFELIQAEKQKKTRPEKYLKNSAHVMIRAISITADWVSIYTAAAEAGRAELAVYLMRKFLNQLVERLGKDDEAFLHYNEYARIIAADGSEWKFAESDNVLTDFAITLQQTKSPKT